MTRSWFVERLRLVNFRCFTDLELDFERDVTVLIGRNGTGKTAALDGLVVLLSTIVREFDGEGRGFYQWDARTVARNLASDAGVGHIEQQYPVRGEVRATLGDRSTNWSRERASESGRTTWAKSDASGIAANYARKARASRGTDPTLPVIAAYGVERLLLQRRNSKPLGASRFSAYAAALELQSDLRRLTPFLKALTTQVASAVALGDPIPRAARAQLEAIDRACAIALEGTGWTRPRWNPIVDGLTLSHPEFGTLPLSALSSGVRITAGLVLDLSSRAARANPSLDASDLDRVPGIVLIDEVDLHLHPEWQQRIVVSLTQTFPCMQFIVTTHSPQVLSTVEARQIRDLGASSLSRQPTHSRGLRSDVILREVMGTAPRPSTPETALLARYMGMVRAGEGTTDEALCLRKKIELVLGPSSKVEELAEADARIAFDLALE